MSIKIKKLREGAIIPVRATDGSAGYDISALLDEPVTIPAHGRGKLTTGLAIALPDNSCVALIYARSGLAIKHGIAPSNCVGVIDSDYRGEIIVGLTNHGDEPYTIQSGERIAQMIIAPVLLPELIVCDELDDTERGGGGFGSTGR